MPEAASYAKIGIIPTPGNNSLSRFYSLPNKLLECVAIGLPIICTNIPEHKKLMEKTGSSKLYSYYNDEKATNEIVDSIKSIHNEYPIYKENALKTLNSFSMDLEYENAFSFLFK